MGRGRYAHLHEVPSIDAIPAGQGPASQKSQKRRSLPFSPQSPLLAPAQATKPKLFAKEKSSYVSSPESSHLAADYQKVPGDEVRCVTWQCRFLPRPSTGNSKFFLSQRISCIEVALYPLNHSNNEPGNQSSQENGDGWRNRPRKGRSASSCSTGLRAQYEMVPLQHIFQRNSLFVVFLGSDWSHAGKH